LSRLRFDNFELSGREDSIKKINNSQSSKLKSELSMKEKELKMKEKELKMIKSSEAYKIGKLLMRFPHFAKSILLKLRNRKPK